jgi:hypothetical protein
MNYSVIISPEIASRHMDMLATFQNSTADFSRQSVLLQVLNYDSHGMRIIKD